MKKIISLILWNINQTSNGNNSVSFYHILEMQIPQFRV